MKKSLIILVIAFTFVLSACEPTSISDNENTQSEIVDPDKVKPPTGG